MFEEIENIPDHIELKIGHRSETELNVWGDRLWVENKDLFNYLEDKCRNLLAKDNDKIQ